MVESFFLSKMSAKQVAPVPSSAPAFADGNLGKLVPFKDWTFKVSNFGKTSSIQKVDIESIKFRFDSDC